MKNYFKLFGIIALAALIGFSMTACDNDDGDSGPLSGTYTLEGGGASISFSGNNFTFSMEGNSFSGSYSVSGSTITFTAEGQSMTGTIIDGNTISFEGGTWRK